MNRLLFVLALVCLLASCRKTFHKSQPTKVEKPTIKISEVDFEYFQSKAKIDYNDGTNQFSSPMTIRIRKDSVIWISVNPALGIEVVRALITQDSVFVIDKIHNHYYARGLDYIKANFGVELSFQMIQSALLGNLIKPIETADSLSFAGDFATLVQGKQGLEIFNHISKSNRKIENVVMTDTPTKNNLTIKYSDFALVDTVNFAFTSELVASYRSKEGIMKSNIAIEHQRVDLKDKQMRFPFNVKNKYGRK